MNGVVAVPCVQGCPDGAWHLAQEERRLCWVRLAHAHLVQSLEIHHPARLAILLGGNVHGTKMAISPR